MRTGRIVHCEHQTERLHSHGVSLHPSRELPERCPSRDPNVPTVRVRTEAVAATDLSSWPRSYGPIPSSPLRQLLGSTKSSRMVIAVSLFSFVVLASHWRGNPRMFCSLAGILRHVLESGGP